jgi:beta-phosphoglucomutase family hydrolase
VTSAVSAPGLPPSIKAVLFDMDGVLTQTARLHAAAWKQMFDQFLSSRASARGEPWEPFDAELDYRLYVDGKIRADGVRSFLRSRGIEMPEGRSNDPPGDTTIHALGNWKNELVKELLRDRGVATFEGSLRYLEMVKEAGLKRAVVSASANTLDVLASSNLTGMFDLVVDGNVAAAEGLRGKPAPDTFLFAVRSLGLEPLDAAVFEDAIAGVQAGREGGFGFVVGVDRLDQAEALRAAGADVVVKDLFELVRGG